MKPAIKQKAIQLAAGFLAVVFGLFIADNVVFMHAHKLSNGQIIVHAHPYKKSADPAPFKSHPHTTSDLYHLSHIQLLFFVSIALIAAQIRLGERIDFYFILPLHSLGHNFSFGGRDPPASRFTNISF